MTNNKLLRISVFLIAALIWNGGASAADLEKLSPPASATGPTEQSRTEGRLSNGLRYAVQRSKDRPGKVKIYLHVMVGSDTVPFEHIEAPHLLEHILVSFYSDETGRRQPAADYFQYLGLDMSAGTNFDDTTFEFTVDANRFDEALALMRQVAQGSQFTPSEAAIHRGVVLAEIERSADNFAPKLQARALGLKNLLAATSEERAKSIRDPFAVVRAIYDKYYSPERQMLVVVGDIEPAVVAKRLKARFDDLEPSGSAAEPEDADSKSEPDFQFLQVERCCTESVGLEIRFLSGQANDADYIPSLLDDVALQILSERLYSIREKLGLPFRNFAPDMPVLSEVEAFRSRERLDGFKVMLTTNPVEIGLARTFIDELLKSVDSTYIGEQLPIVMARQTKPRDASISDEIGTLLRSLDDRTLANPDAGQIRPDDINAIAVEATIRRWLSGRVQVTVWSKKPLATEVFAKRQLAFEMLSVARPSAQDNGIPAISSGFASALASQEIGKPPAVPQRDETKPSDALRPTFAIQSIPGSAYVELTLVNMSGMARATPCQQEQRRFIDYMIKASGAGGMPRDELVKTLSARGMTFTTSVGIDRSFVTISGPSELQSEMAKILESYALRPQLLDAAYEEAHKYYLYYDDDDEIARSRDYSDQAIARFAREGTVAPIRCRGFIPLAKARQILASQFGAASGVQLLASGSVTNMATLQALADVLRPRHALVNRRATGPSATAKTIVVAAPDFGEHQRTPTVDVVATVLLNATLRDRPAIRALTAVLARRVWQKLREEDGAVYTPLAWSRYDRSSGKLILLTRSMPRDGTRAKVIVTVKSILSRLLSEGLSEADAAILSSSTLDGGGASFQALIRKLEYGWRPGETDEFPAEPVDVEAVNNLLKRCGMPSFLIVG